MAQVVYIIVPCMHCKNIMYINDDETKCEYCGNTLPIADAAAHPIRQIITVDAEIGESQATINDRADAIARTFTKWRYDARVANGVPADDDFNYIPPGSTVVRLDCPACGEIYRQGFTDADAEGVGKQIIEAAQQLVSCKHCGNQLGELKILKGA
jgi:ribosomal protein S27E